MRNSRLFICFIGMDGCGKTTHTGNLYKELRRRGIDCTYIHHTYSLIDHLPSMIRTWFQKLFLSQTGPSIISTNKKTFRSKTSMVVLSLMSFIHGLVSYLFEPKPYAGYSLVIHDRYLYDHLIHYLDSCPKWLVRCYMQLILKPDVIFLLDVPPRVAYERKGEGSLNFYTRYRKLYLALTKELDQKGLTVVSTHADINKVHSLILDQVLRLFDGATPLRGA